MRTIIPILLSIFLCVLGACTDVVEIEKIVIVHDTIQAAPKFIDRIVVDVDTIETPGKEVPVYITKDSIIYVQSPPQIQIVTEYHDRVIMDTVVISTTIYRDTLYIQPGRGTHSIPKELQPMVTQFFKDAQDHGYVPTGGLLFVTIEKIDDVLQAYSYNTYAQLNIVLNSNQTFDEMFLPLYRELARHQIGRQYSQDPTDLMYPFYPSNKIRWSNRGQFKNELDEVFE